MRRILLATTAISALALAPALGLAQAQSNGPSGALQEQPRDQEKVPPKGKPATPVPGPTAPGKSVQTQTPPQQPRQLQGQAQPNGPQNLQGQVQQPAGTAQHPTGTAGTSGGARTQVQVTQQQRTEIHQRLAHTRVERIEHPQFSVSVGVVIPRSVRIEVLPLEIVEIVPEYRGFDYVMVGDDILIIDPISLQIVAVIPA